eukprot:12570330-Ditylum_brightwellii.AAC.1
MRSSISAGVAACAIAGALFFGVSMQIHCPDTSPSVLQAFHIGVNRGAGVHVPGCAQDRGFVVRCAVQMCAWQGVSGLQGRV